MGYSVEMFAAIDQLDLQSNDVLDIGAQDLTIACANQLAVINQFISRRKPDNTLSLSNFPMTLPAKEIYERAGYCYTNIDVDERPGTLRIDLAAFQIPRPRKRYALVVNVGTTEHLVSPIVTFALMHELCATDGFLFNDVPLFGMGNHGLINPTPKFWHALIWMNQYKIMTTTIRTVDESSMDKGNIYLDYMQYFEGLAAIVNSSHIIRAVLQKTTTNLFVPPFDAVFPDADEGKSLARLLAGSYLPFIKTGAYTKQEVVAGINAFLQLNNRPYRATRYNELLMNNFLSDTMPSLKQWLPKLKHRLNRPA